MQELSHCLVEPSLKEAKQGDQFQFLRLGYFCVDNDSKHENLIFNRTVGLRDSWARIERSIQQKEEVNK